MKAEVMYKSNYTVYDCAEDINHPCWDGKQNGQGTCGTEINLVVVKEAEDVFVVVEQAIRYDTHSGYSSDHVSVRSEYEEINRFSKFEDAKQYVIEQVEGNRYKPEENYLPENYIKEEDR